MDGCVCLNREARKGSLGGRLKKIEGEGEKDENVQLCLLLCTKKDSLT